MKLYDFLNKYKSGKGASHTHTSLYDKKTKTGVAGSYFIPEENLDEFYKYYKEDVIKNNSTYHLVEKHQEIGPIIYDIDLRFLKKDDRIYDNEFIVNFIKKINEELELYFEDPNYECFVFEKKKAYMYNDTLMKDGIHIMYPFINSEPNIQYMIRNKLLVSCKEIINKLQVENKIDDIIDECIIEKNGWQMYGCCKPGNEAYKLTYIYTKSKDDNLILIPITKYNNLELPQLLSIRNRKTSNVLKDNTFLDLSIYSNQKTKKKTITKEVNKVSGFQNFTEDLESVKEFIQILDENRSKTYKHWIQLGWCLHNIDYRLLGEWIEFSKKSSQHSSTCEEECTQLWNNMSNTGYSIGSLHHWCKEDNLTAYNELLEQKIDHFLNNGSKLDGTSYDVAVVIHYIYKYNFKCDAISHNNNNWYEFKDNRWYNCDSAITIRKNIPTKIYDIYSKMQVKYLMLSHGLEQNSERELYISKANTIANISKKLKTTAFKEQIIKELKELFYHDKFNELLDCNTELIGFENGVYDLENHEFRPGKPEDYLSYSCKINYVELDNDSPTLHEIYDFFDKVLPNKNIQNYVLTFLASCLSGNIRSQTFHFWTGSGGNGKSKIVELFESCFGDYCGKLPHSVITQKRPASNACTPEMLKTKGKRFICMQEPDSDEKINVGYMKEITGGDKISVRGLHKDPIEFNPQFKLLLTCNELPKIPSDDGGTWRRVRVVHFKSKFVEHPCNENEFLIDLDLTSKMKSWREMFMSLLINVYYKRYKFGDKELGIKEGLEEPIEVLEHTNNYRKKSDLYQEFTSENIEEHACSYLKIKDMYEAFKIWHKDSSSEKCPSKADCQAYMVKKYGSYDNKKGWRGIRIIRHNDEFMEEPGIQENM